MSKEFRLATGDEIRGALEYGDQVYVMLDTESSAAPVPPQDDAQPVAGQSRFTSQKDWQPCGYEHHLMVIANPSEWPGYETRALYTRPDASEVERLRAELETLRQQHAEQSCVFCNDSGELLTEVKTLRAKLAEAHALFADVLSIDVPRTAQSLERMRSILAARAEPKWFEPGENPADYKGPFRTCPAGEVATEIEWEVTCPSGLFIRDSGSAEPNNQCDGCRAGIPLINGMHRMGKPGEYPDLMACTSKRYDYDPDEPANKESGQ